ncbi:MAG: DUF4760 domain-containing protein [Bacteroidales bacterium]|nr:DUF4760 domain-containing protein [Bacteroidales bacterium]
MEKLIILNLVLGLSIFEFFTLLVGFITLLILISQVYYLRRSLNADHSRRRKQATFDYLAKVRPQWHDTRNDLDILIQAAGEKANIVNVIIKNPEILKKVRLLLGLLEHISVGIHTDVFDKEILYRMSGKQLKKIYEKFEPYIKYVQIHVNETAYTEFQNLVLEFNLMVSNPPKKDELPVME